jgi:hypothetical protein
MKAKVQGRNLVIELPLEEPKMSGSGKTMLVASSHGVRQSKVKIDGKKVLVVANAFYHPDERQTEVGGRPKMRPQQKRAKSAGHKESQLPAGNAIVI